MNITLYPLADYNNGHLNPFTIELDDIDADEFQQATAQGLWDNSNIMYSNVISTKCHACGHVFISQQLEECPECGNEALYFNPPHEENYEGEYDLTGLEQKPTNEEWIVCDSEDVPKRYVGEYDLDPEFFEYSQFLKEHSWLDKDAVNAGLDAEVSLDNIEEAYSGQFDSDEAFAENLAEEIGAIDSNATWPNTCINWEQAARELMYDYTESNGYYFRNL